jgi:hypothetical protein
MKRSAWLLVLGAQGRVGRVEEGDGTGGGFIGEELGEGRETVIVDGDAEIFPPVAADVIVLPVAGDAVVVAFVAHDWRCAAGPSP